MVDKYKSKKLKLLVVNDDAYQLMIVKTLIERNFNCVEKIDEA